MSHSFKNLFAFILFAISMAMPAFAQTSWQSNCQYVNAASREALDKEGRAVGTAEYSCRTVGGPLDNSVLSGINVVEWNGTSGVAVAGYGAARKPTGMAVFTITEMKVSVVMKDGKPAGLTSSGKAKFTLTSGDGSALSGKSFSFSTKVTGPAQFVIDSTLD